MSPENIHCTSHSSTSLLNLPLLLLKLDASVDEEVVRELWLELCIVEEGFQWGLLDLHPDRRLTRSLK